MIDKGRAASCCPLLELRLNMDSDEQEHEEQDVAVIIVKDIATYDGKLVICSSEDLEYEPSETFTLLLAKDFDID